jgi:hypothetical protein
MNQFRLDQQWRFWFNKSPEERAKFFEPGDVKECPDIA